MTKTEKLQQGAIDIIANSKDVFDAYEEFNEYMKQQQFIKNIKRANHLCQFLPCLIIAELKKYTDKPRQEKLVFEQDYIQQFDDYIYKLYQQVLYKYKYISGQGDYTLASWTNWTHKVLKKRYNILYPEYIQAKTLFDTIVKLRNK